MKIAIVGAGITGLATALALHRRGIEAHVYERTDAFREIGLGFIVMPNGVAALRQLGALPQTPHDAMWLAGGQLLTPEGEVFKTEALEDCLASKRSRLIDALMQQLPPALLHTGCDLHQYEWDAQGRVVAAHFSNGQKAEADYFIAADGANSISRRLLHPHHPLRHTPIQELVGIAEAPELARQLGPYLQKAQDWDQHLSFGILPCCDEQVIWYMQYHSGINPLPGLTADEKKRFTETLMKGWPAIVQQAIAATDFDSVFCWQTRDMDLLPSFHQGNLVLAGDAAHVALPFTSQGTSSGLSDALLLSELFASGAVENDAEAAFADYYQRRRADVFTYLQFGRHLEQRFLHPEAFVGMDMPMPLAK